MVLRLMQVPMEILESAWRDAAPFVNDALQYAHDGMTLSQVRLLLSRQEAQLLVMVAPEDLSIQGAVVVSIKDYANFRVCFIVAAGGHGPTTQAQMYADLESHAKQLGCRYIEGNVRKSVARLLKPIGFSEVCTVIRKQL